MNPITAALSKVSGLPEATLRLLLTLILAYPLSLVYTKRFLNKEAKASTTAQRQQYILAAGLGLNFFFNGLAMYHSLITIGMSYGLCYVIGEQKGDRKVAAGSVWVFNALYLLVGYYVTATDDYDITWTMTQCILCLRLMGFGFDYYDGVQNAEKEVEKTAITKENEQKKAPQQVLPLSFMADTPLTELPPLLDILAYCMFPSAFLVGPQFSFSLYKKWINDARQGLTNEQLSEREKAQNMYVWRCVVLSVAYLGLQQTLGAIYSSSYLLTEEYSSLNIFKRLLILFVAGKFGFNKYIGIWLLTEGATASFGISYEGVNSEGHASFGGLANALPTRYETATSTDYVIGAFNINTNLWSKYYVFKRLRFLGNKQLSQFGTLLFLAIWHGFHAMYFVTFLLEFLYTQCELVFRKRIGSFVQPYVKEENTVYYYLWKAVCWCACQMCVTYAMVGFELLNVDKAITAYKNVYFIGHLIVPVIFAVDRFAPKPMSLKKKAQ